MCNYKNTVPFHCNANFCFQTFWWETHSHVWEVGLWVKKVAATFHFFSNLALQEVFTPVDMMCWCECAYLGDMIIASNKYLEIHVISLGRGFIGSIEPDVISKFSQKDEKAALGWSWSSSNSLRLLDFQTTKPSRHTFPLNRFFEQV